MAQVNGADGRADQDERQLRLMLAHLLLELLQELHAHRRIGTRANYAQADLDQRQRVDPVLKVRDESVVHVEQNGALLLEFGSLGHLQGLQSQLMPQP